ncbi:cell division protein FtsA [Porphyromonas sp.]|uniref:cell division protein FtsA n=1 Tax=Porphyromonas sp. TaxID=1924944 RepID=UPI0026DB38C8|nr:cell division protein FtsA [Porphyromonas sp.]MDO4770384.1 cell division protein FtsA [Porphyromonas sp.]
MQQNSTITVVVIDFGTYVIKGALAEKHADGQFDILYYADEPSDDCIKRGVIYNMEVAAQKAQSVISRLEKLYGKKINKVYSNIGGHTLRTIRHVESLAFEMPHEITAEDIDTLYEKVEGFTHDKYEQLLIDSPQYFINSNYTTSPIGVQALKIDARFQLIVASPQMRSNVQNVIEKKLNLEVAGLPISPLVLSKTFLNEDQKKLGCVLIDFGSGSTTICVFRNDLLTGLRVIPLGAQNITKDIMAMHITESEAERIKKQDGSAIAEPSDKSMIEVNAADKLSTKQISKYELCRFIEARTKEIIDNVVHHMKEMIKPDDIGGGVIVTGGGSEMRGLLEKLVDALKMRVEVASALITNHRQNTPYINNPKLHLIYAMIDYASQDCVERPLGVQQPEASALKEKEGTDTYYPEDAYIQKREGEQPSLFTEDELPPAEEKEIDVIHRGKQSKRTPSRKPKDQNKDGKGVVEKLLGWLIPMEED